MVIGLVLCVTLLVSFPYVIKSMNIDLSEDYSTKKVFTRAGDLFKKAFDVWKIIKESQKENEFRWNMFYDLNNKSSDIWSYNL